MLLDRAGIATVPPPYAYCLAIVTELIERSTFHVSVTVSITSITAPEEYEGEYEHRLPVAGSYTVTEIGRRLSTSASA